MAKKKASRTGQELEEDFRSWKYGPAKERLEKLLEELEADEVDLDDLAERVKEAAALIRVLHEKLTRTQGEVDKIMDQVRQQTPPVPPVPPGENPDSTGECIV